ncbi:MAG: tetratricopeptide repeat protein [Verrucomicrobiales bacterium]
MSETTEIKEIGAAELTAAQRDHWKKAKASVERNNHAYAVKFIQAILKDAPGFLEGRRLLRSCEAAAAAGKEKKKGLFGSSGGGGGLSAMKLQGMAKKDPAEALQAVEKELEKDPYNATYNEILHDAAYRLNLLDTAAFALETVRKGSPENTKLLHKLADFYMARNMPQEAADVYRDIQKQDPTDGAAITGEKNASAKASMQKGKWEQENLDVRDLQKNKEETSKLEQDSREGLTRDQLEERAGRFAAQYQEDPHNIEVVKKLAAVYEQLEDWPNAHQFYDWAFQLSNGDVALKHKATFMKGKSDDFQIKQLEEQLEQDPDNAELKAQLDSTKRELMSARLAECRQRVEQNPTDPQLRYELGDALYKSGEYSEAIPHLQQATRNPHIRIRVLLLLGRTFNAKGMTDLAIKQLSDANSELVAMDSTKKEILYELGLIYDKAGRKDEALECFKQIYEIDYGYRDVAARVEGSYSS